MFSQINIPSQEDFEFDLENIGLVGFQLVVDQDAGIFISNHSFRFYFSSDFLKLNSLHLIEEDNSVPTLIVTPDQKLEILRLLKSYTNLL